MHHSVVITFESIVVEEQVIRGGAGDYLLATVKFSFKYPDGRADSYLSARVKQFVNPPSTRNGGGGVTLEVSAPNAYREPFNAVGFCECVADYFLSRVGPMGTVIRTGRHGASPYVLHTVFAAPSRAEFSLVPPDATSVGDASS